MKKILFLIPLLLLNLSIVSADTYSASNFYDKFEDLISLYQNNSTIVDTLVQYWDDNYSSSYPYYAINYYSSGNNNDWLVITGTKSNLLKFSYFDTSLITQINFTNDTISYGYNFYTQTYGTPISTPPVYLSNGNYNPPIGFSYLISSNYNYIFKASINSPFDVFHIPTYINQNLSLNFPVYELHDGDNYPSLLSLYNAEYQVNDSVNYTEINLNNYEYVILSLKDYSLRNNENNQFYTYIYVKGQLCYTPVYNYGMNQKQDYYPTTQVQSCSSSYSDYTPLMVYIIKPDLENHAVYYVKSPNYGVINSIKVDTSIYDITYITSSNVNNPSVVIDGRSYPVIPYDVLTDTAIISSEEGYVSGRVCAVGDVNCEYETGIGLDISDLFSNPIKVLQDVWSSITSFFALISTFILLIPSPMKEFLISAFMLSIVLGVIKIVIG